MSSFALDANAQGQGPGSAWAQQIINQGLMSPHMDNCGSGETFIAIVGNLGICMDDNEQSADDFIDARNFCMAAGKRLPEPTEFKYACLNNPGSLNNMTGNTEWVTNFDYLLIEITGYFNGTYATAAGYNGCGHVTSGIVTKTGASPESFAFRCVR